MSGANFGELRRAGHRIIDQIIDYWECIEQRPVAPGIDRAELFDRFEHTLHDDGVGLETSVGELESVFDASMAMSHPLYLGLVNSSPLPEAVLGDLVVSALDNNGGASHQGPVNAAAENEVIRWLATRLGYAPCGMILPGGSHATLQALHVAKVAQFPDWLRLGPAAVHALPRVYFSSATHFSVARAARVIGLGEECLAPVPVTGRGAMDAEALETLICQDRELGRRPFAVVATAGTTGTGAIDPLNQIGTICQQQNLWYHVDACYGGALALIDAHRERFSGMLQADSICIDLHKWLFMPLTAGVLLTRHQELVNTTFDVSASYIPDGDFVEAYCRGLPTSRRGSGLAVWFGLRTAGWKVIEEAILGNIRLTRRLEGLLRDRGFRLLEEGELSIACARWEPRELSADALDRLQAAISERVRREGHAWFADTLHDDQLWLRFNMVNLHSRDEHVDRLADLVTETAQRVARETAG